MQKMPHNNILPCWVLQDLLITVNRNNIISKQQSSAPYCFISALISAEHFLFLTVSSVAAKFVKLTKSFIVFFCLRLSSMYLFNIGLGKKVTVFLRWLSIGPSFVVAVDSACPVLARSTKMLPFCFATR
jgi:hypothetical protein